MGEQNRQEARCKGCGNPISGSFEQPGNGGDVYCGQCLMNQAERYIKDTPAEKPKLQRLRETLGWRVFMILIIIVCSGVIFYQGPRIRTAFKEPKPIRMGSYETDEVTDKCIKNLWKIAALIQRGSPVEGQPPGCPVSGKPYLIKSGTNTEAHCPNPGAHGFRDIIVTKKNPVPELKR
ncbi:MAG: hypothetical protein QG555_1325 [Thermodesulfobacteriota bacterium]|nr:hypothetical protein [Thermodesulfobacteriota bacterium]